jgi:hypothetical protein
MAATPTNYDVAVIPAGITAQIWANLGVPSAGARLTLAADGTPDDVGSPDAIHLGHTDAGLTITATESVIEFPADEVPYPIASTLDTMEVSITGSALQVNDFESLEPLTENFATYSTAAGYRQFTLGYKAAIQYTSVAVIFPTPMDSTKYAVFQLYNARNTTGFTFQVGRKVRGMTPFTFKGYGLTARAAADQMGNYWWQI